MLITLAVALGCLSAQDTDVELQSDDARSTSQTLSTRGLFCPPGTTPDLAQGYCVDGTNAYGPFTSAMRRRCIEGGGGAPCDATLRFDIDGHAVDIPRWNRNFASALRGAGECPLGAVLDRNLRVCVEGDDAFGPFPTAILALCIVNGGGDACYTNRWGRAFYAGMTATRRPNFDARSTLEYHEVTPGPDRSLPAGMAVSTGHLARLAASYSAERTLITFDDGYASVVQHALPVLAAKRVPAVAAIIVEATRDSGSPDALSNHMSRSELVSLVRAGWAIALHSGTVAEHELNYARMAEILRDGVVSVPGRSPSSVPLDDQRAEAWLADLTNQATAPTARLLAQLRTDRANVVRRLSSMSATAAATEVLTERLSAERRRLADLAQIPSLAIDTFIYPHSESNTMVRTAAARAGFARAYAGGPIGDANDAFNLPRQWMNDATAIP
jgi:peptidoglycan/xylan/chitin deacetylase (PgdA/CDA1 family)